MLAEYEAGWSLRDIFSPNGDPAPGIVTTHDDFAISWTAEEAAQKVERLLATATETEARELFMLCSQDQWRYERAKQELADGKWRERIVPILYRPFDIRWTVYDRNVAVHRRERAFDNFVWHENIGIAMMRQASGDIGYSQILAINTIADNRALFSSRGVMAASPLWLYSRSADTDLFHGASHSKSSNFSPDFLSDLAAKAPAASPEEAFAYLYAILYASSYRSRYHDFLKRDFPRVPLSKQSEFFGDVALFGHELIELHTMRRTLPRITSFDVAGTNEVVKPRFAVSVPSGAPALGRVYINDAQYFDRVPLSVWEMHVGGYRVAEKWLKDRKGRLLSYDDLTHYQAVIAALSRTLELQSAIDVAIEAAGGWPLQ